MTKITKLPDYNKTVAKIENGEKLNPIEIFINEQSLAEIKQDEQWRKQLLDLILFIQRE
jgi:hypothetical protein